MRPITLRNLLRLLFIGIGSVALTCGLGGCLFASLEVLSVYPSLARPGDTELPIAVNSIWDGGDEPDFLSVVNLDNSPATDVILTDVRRELIPQSGNHTFSARLTVTPTAVPRVVLMKVTTLIQDDPNRPISDTIPFTIGEPPRIDEIVTAGGAGASAFAARTFAGAVAGFERGRAVPVEIRGAGFDATAQVLAEDPAMLITGVSFDDNSGSLFATITTPANGRTGRLRIFVQSARGISNFFELAVRAVPGGGGDEPRIDNIFPNFVYPGSDPSEFIAMGANLQNPSGLAFAPAVATVEDVEEFFPSQARLGSQLYISFVLPSPAPTNTLGLMVSTENGTLISNAVTLAVLDAANPTGPEISTLDPSVTAVVSDSVFQFKIFGSRFGSTGPTALLHFASLYDDPIRGVRLFPPSSPQAAENTVVVQLDLALIAEQENQNNGYFALNVNGLITQAFGIGFVEPPITGPFVSRTSIGEIARGQTITETILGARLTNVTGIIFPDTPISGRVTVSNIVQSTDGGASFTADFTASSTAILTGDSLTNFQVVTTGNVRSNRSGYIVKP